MSRRIKSYPFHEAFNDTLECDADSVSEFELPGVRMQCFNFENDTDEITTFRSVARAEEERKGIFIKLVEEDSDGNLTKNESEEIVVDEEQFCDAIYEAINGGDTAEDSEFIQKAVYDAAQKYAMSELSGGKWFFRISYKGFGIICTGDEIIGTVETVEFNKDNVVLDYCVSNINLNQVEDCNIKFSVGGKCFKLTNFTMESVSGRTENLCTYVLKDYHGEIIDSISVDDEVLESMIPYDESSEDEFIKQRVQLVDGNKTDDNSFFDDNIEDLL